MGSNLDSVSVLLRGAINSLQSVEDRHMIAETATSSNSLLLDLEHNIFKLTERHNSCLMWQMGRRRSCTACSSTRFGVSARLRCSKKSRGEQAVCNESLEIFRATSDCC